MHVLPSLVCKLTHAHEAWVVGSAAKPDADHATVRDYDVLVPLTHWQNAAMLIPEDAKPNTFGGWKCVSEGREVDVWPGDLAWLMTNRAASWAWHPRTGVRLSVHNAGDEARRQKTNSP